jgi:16S rRNA (guanine(966)-N(2))-methyltransferase RsmD
MRIISGRYKSRRLKGAPVAGIRPTSDKLNETIFNVLGAEVQGSVFLDGCAGTGGIGIEALSRGAQTVYFIEQSKKACRIIRENLRSLGIQEGYKILEMDLIKGLERCLRDGVHFDIAFLDPPYEHEDLHHVALEHFAGAPAGLLIIEHSKRKDLPDFAGGLEKIRSLVQGDARLAFYRRVRGPE